MGHKHKGQAFSLPFKGCSESFGWNYFTRM